jgi:hypothetical protein
MLYHIIFYTTDADVIADSHKILSGIISTDGSTLITDTLEGSKQGLDVLRGGKLRPRDYFYYFVIFCRLKVQCSATCR